ncbi:hypothetical protein Rt10032_c02g1085 [Rhodotorula toruloides]|uniref:Uncharacterized protein n=1 Tax=Rhodotorula toruloides TaxID=5286 RepID=A0A511K9N5_RHOTO|nr:hypothetical protein Rt10032_c02g1085 [Rhodotorula toruloides]
MMYQLLTALMSTAPPPLNARPTIAQTLENWVVPFFALGVEAYYVYRAVHVTKHRILQALAISLGFAALVGFLGFAVVNTQIRFGAAIPPKQALTYIFSACWAFALDGLVCASILVYELVYKRRATNVKSSLVQQFAEVALRSSGLVVVMLISTAVVVTLAYVSENPVYVQTSVAISRIFPFISCCIVLTCLLERPSLNDSYTDPTLTFGSTLDAVTASRQPRPSTQVFAVTVLPTDDDEESSPMDEKGEGGGGIGKLDLSYSATGSSRSSRSSWLRDGGREAR